MLSLGHLKDSKSQSLCWSGGTGQTRRYAGEVGLAHQVVAAGDGQGERGVAAPQQVGVGSVGQQEPDDVPGALGGERGRRTAGYRGTSTPGETHTVRPSRPLTAPPSH